MKEERLKEHKFRKEKKKGIWGLRFGGNRWDFWEGFRMLFWKPHTQLFVDIHWRFTLRLKRWVPTYLVEYEGRGSADAPKRENKERMRDYFSEQGKAARGLRDFFFQNSRTILGMRGTLRSKIDSRTKRKNERRWESKQRAEWGSPKEEQPHHWKRGGSRLLREGQHQTRRKIVFLPLLTWEDNHAGRGPQGIHCLIKRKFEFESGKSVWSRRRNNGGWWFPSDNDADHKCEER